MPTRIRRTISLPRDVDEQAAERAKRQRRAYSNYIRILIEKDVANPQPVNVAFAPKPEQPREQEGDVQ